MRPPLPLPAPTLEVALRAQLTTVDCTDKNRQNPIVEFVLTRDTARAALRAQAAKVAEAMQDATVTDQQMATVLNELQVGLEDEQAKTQTALDALNAKIHYIKQPRLQAFLTLLGELGEHASLLDSFADRMQYLAGMNAPNRLLEVGIANGEVLGG